MPMKFLPQNCQRVAEIASFGPLQQSQTDGLTELGDANGRYGPGPYSRVIVCSRYHYVYPFMPEFHDADPATVNAETKVLVTDAEDSSPFCSGGDGTRVITPIQAAVSTS